MYDLALPTYSDQVSSMAAKKEADAVAVIKEACMADARRIAGEKGDAEEDLAQAKPFLEEAERAVESIKVRGCSR